ncbi:sensor histidine kinase [Salidesulfovibrio brasiliensis]|uniref:sensor histidine kinase n=1 Tax=Salidesulfovibrio brasiliensis TaxID=221711 RepID=UPI0006D17DF2|nr:HAMP domain-containing sensor histidine kinase [Salidesulfovibrio brasiliensis]
MRQIIEPQLERYRNRLEERGIQLDFSLGGVPDQAIRMIVDVGLLSQVYANLFSNAVKYTGKTTLPDGREGRFLSYGWKVIKDHFGKGKSGIHMWVFTSGDPLELDDPMTLFDPGYRADNTNHEHGTGHGLYFVRQVVELHRGDVGVKTCPYGNEINFTLPFQVQA